MVDRRKYEDEAFTTLPPGGLAGADVERCTFLGVDITEGSLRGTRLDECRFERCEMTLVDVTDATFHDVTFAACRLQAVDFGALHRDPVGTTISFERCDLGLAVFRGLDMRGIAISGGRAHEARLLEVDLREVTLRDVDLSGAEFRACDLRGADLRGSHGFVFSPCTNKVRGLRIDAPAVAGLMAALGVTLE